MKGSSQAPLRHPLPKWDWDRKGAPEEARMVAPVYSLVDPQSDLL